jgi:hypothetical protein
MDADAAERLRTELEALDGVRRAVVDADPFRVYLICERADCPAEMQARAVLARAGHASSAELNLAFLPQSETRKRVRFVAAHLTKPAAGRALAHVRLEWAGQTFEDEVEGESGPALELRHAAAATLRTLEAILQGRMGFSLVGIKTFRAFDTELIVVLLRTEAGVPLVGASLATTDAYRSAALAVLNATNRVLGNYLANTEGSA